jgi:hypothetical protein
VALFNHLAELLEDFVTIDQLAALCLASTSFELCLQRKYCSSRFGIAISDTRPYLNPRSQVSFIENKALWDEDRPTPLSVVVHLIPE